MKSLSVQSRGGFSLLEQLMVFTFLALGLLLIARLLVFSRTITRYTRNELEANCKARDQVEWALSQAIANVPLGLNQALPPGSFSNGQDYTAWMDVSGPPSADPQAAGLTSADMKVLSVKVSWIDQSGGHLAVAEAYLTRVPPH